MVRGIWWEAARVWRAGEQGWGMAMPAAIGREELQALTGQGAQLAEVLPAEEYAWAHLRGALAAGASR